MKNERIEIRIWKRTAPWNPSRHNRRLRGMLRGIQRHVSPRGLSRLQTSASYELLLRVAQYRRRKEGNNSVGIIRRLVVHSAPNCVGDDSNELSINELSILLSLVVTNHDALMGDGIDCCWGWVRGSRWITNHHIKVIWGRALNQICAKNVKRHTTHSAIVNFSWFFKAKELSSHQNKVEPESNEKYFQISR